MSYKVSKISLNPSRKINLGGYETADLSAGIELVFDTPLETNSPELQKAFEEARQIVKDEMKLQYEPYKKMFEKKGGGK